ncbi:Hydroxyacylglutathione hydrolase, mitochondrial [Pseudozyma hubeiensis]|nr:Hydroxyacylglutathione hydrolase, mitochondrial [Pseudozyma hubeiensis]
MSCLKMKIHPVPVRDDNYAYILQSSVDGSAVFVDPYDVDAVSSAATKLGISKDKVVGLLTTHHHHDHSGGNDAFSKSFPGKPVFGGSDQIPALTKKVVDGDSVNDLLQGVNIKCLSTPCHTQDHICYHVVDSSTGKQGVFTGDTLFISGCGRFFEGTPTEMLSAMDKLSSLPADTLVYCGHEYTKSNVAFSAAILPANESAISQLVKDLQDKKNGGVTTGVYTIADEKKHNPFMRCRDQVVKDKLVELGAAGAGGKVESEVEVMRLLRELKNGGQVKANI